MTSSSSSSSSSSSNKGIDLDKFDKKDESGVPARFRGKTYYEVFEVDSKASAADIKKAYRRLALRFHPDHNKSETAKEEFQFLAKVHSILSDTRKRQIYDQTGEATEDSSSIDNWSEYWRSVFPKITTKDIDDFKAKYIGSPEEEEDLAAAFVKRKGNMNQIMESVPFASSASVDRFLKLIERWLAEGKLDKQYQKKFEATSKNLRARLQKVEASEAAELADDAKRPHKDKENELHALIHARKAAEAQRQEAFFEALTAKYSKQEKSSAKSKGEKRSAKAAELEPTEEEFQRARASLEAKAKQKKKQKS